MLVCNAYIILGDPGADSGDEGKSKRAEKCGAKKSKERREAPLGTMSYQTSSKRSLPFWLLIGARKPVFFFVPFPTKQQTKHLTTLSVCKNVRILIFWGYGLRSKRFQGSRLYSKIILGLRATKRWGSAGYGHPPPPPLWDPEEPPKMLQ